MNQVNPADPAARFQSGIAHLQAGRPIEAADVFRTIVRDLPRSSDGRRLFGLALHAAGDDAGAEGALRTALALDPGSGPAIYALADFLLDLGRAGEALDVLEPMARSTEFNLLTVRGSALKSVGRLNESLDAYAQAAAIAPGSAVADHNLAGVLGDLERFAESEMAARRALAKGLKAPETSLVLARSLLGQRRIDEAEVVYRSVLGQRPDDPAAHAELGQLIWMKTADKAAATKILDQAILAFPQSMSLRLKKAELLRAAGDLDGALAAVTPALEILAAEPTAHIIAARCCLPHDPASGLAHAEAAVRRAPSHPGALAVLCEARLALGDTEAAIAVAEALLRLGPLDQYARGLLATGWRLAADPRYRDLYDYDAFIRAQTIDTPEGWPDLEAYLNDLASEVDALHAFRTHPIGQSVRNGSQTAQRLTEARTPAVQAFFPVVGRSIARYIDGLGAGDDPMRSRIAAGWRFNGEWSVRLSAGGYHACHVHPKGWISSAFYIRLPAAVDRDCEGWLKFGEPGVATAPALPAETYVKPEPGMLVLFPSYMWHGTVPFADEQPRLTVAFDVVPV